MSLTTTRRELKNARLYFVPAGTVLPLGAGAAPLTVSPTAAFPDNDPVTNYTDWQFKDIEEVKESLTVKSEDFMIPGAGPGYDGDNDDIVTARHYAATTHKTNSLVKQLQHGLASVPVVGVTQALGVNKSNVIEGVLLIEMVEQRLGVVTERLSMWAKLRVKSPGDVGPTTSKVELDFAMMPHPSNSYVLVA